MAGSEHTDNALHFQLSTDPHTSPWKGSGDAVLLLPGGGEETKAKAFALVQFVTRRKRKTQTLSPVSPAVLSGFFLCAAKTKMASL